MTIDMNQDNSVFVTVCYAYDDVMSVTPSNKVLLETEDTEEIRCFMCVQIFFVACNNVFNRINNNPQEFSHVFCFSHCTQYACVLFFNNRTTRCGLSLIYSIKHKTKVLCRGTIEGKLKFITTETRAVRWSDWQVGDKPRQKSSFGRENDGRRQYYYPSCHQSIHLLTLFPFFDQLLIAAHCSPVQRGVKTHISFQTDIQIKWFRSSG